MFVIFFDHSETKGAPKSIFLLVSEIFRLFFNIWTPDDKYCISVKASVYRDQFKCYYVQIKNYLLIFFLHFRNLNNIWNTFEDRMILWGYLLLKL